MDQICRNQFPMLFLVSNSKKKHFPKSSLLKKIGQSFHISCHEIRYIHLVLYLAQQDAEDNKSKQIFVSNWFTLVQEFQLVYQDQFLDYFTRFIFICTRISTLKSQILIRALTWTEILRDDIPLSHNPLAFFQSQVYSEAWNHVAMEFFFLEDHKDSFLLWTNLPNKQWSHPQFYIQSTLKSIEKYVFDPKSFILDFLRESEMVMWWYQVQTDSLSVENLLKSKRRLEVAVAKAMIPCSKEILY